MSEWLGENITLRSWVAGGIEDLDLRIQVFDMLPASYSDKTCAELNWLPMQLNLTSGTEPSSIVFRIPNDVMESADKSALSIVRAKSYFKVAAFSGKLLSYQDGLSRKAAAVPRLISTGSTSEADKRQQSIFNYSTWPRIQVAIMVRSGKKHHVGTFYLSNISEGDDNGVIATFNDARWINERKVLSGAYVRMKLTSNANEYARVYDPNYPLVFNPGGRGNKTIRNATSGASALGSLQQILSFCEPHEVGDGDLTSKWTLSDMLQYLWLANDGVQGIEWPTSQNNKSFMFFMQLGGDDTPEISIEGKSLTEAINVIISAAANYGWTVRPKSRYDSSTPVLWIYEKNRWQADDASGAQPLSANFVPVVMPTRNFYLPTPGIPVQGSEVNVSAHKMDMHFVDRYGRVEVLGDPIIIESTFSTDDEADESCKAFGDTAGSGTATLHWAGDLAAFQAAYIAASGGKQKRLQAASVASDVAYRLVSFKPFISSSYNSVNGFGFANHVKRISSRRREFLPYRLPKPDGVAPFYEGEAHQYPDILVWVRKPSATEWTLLDEKGRAKVGGFDVDPDSGGIRFGSHLVEIAGSGTSTTFTTWDVRVTAAMEFGEFVRAEAYWGNTDGSSIQIVTQNRYRKWLRWNALEADSTTYSSEIVLDEGDKCLREAKRRLCEFSRLRTSGEFTIPWVEMLYQVGDFVKNVRAGSSVAGAGFPHTKFDIDAAVVSVRFNFQGPPYQTEVYTESEMQREG